MLRLVCSSHFSVAVRGKSRKKKKESPVPPPPQPPTYPTTISFYLGPNEQFTWLVKEVVKPAKAEGKQRRGCTRVHFPQVELLSPVLPDLTLVPGVSGRGECVYTLCQTLKERMASIHNSKRETIFKMKEHAIKSAGRPPLFYPLLFHLLFL